MGSGNTSALLQTRVPTDVASVQLSQAVPARPTGFVEVSLMGGPYMAHPYNRKSTKVGNNATAAWACQRRLPWLVGFFTGIFSNTEGQDYLNEN